MGLKKGAALLSSNDKKHLKALGGKIREIREKKKLTVYDVTGEDMLIKSRQHWQKIEAGNLSLTFVTFLKIAQSLEVQPNEILKGF